MFNERPEMFFSAPQRLCRPLALDLQPAHSQVVFGRGCGLPRVIRDKLLQVLAEPDAKPAAAPRRPRKAVAAAE